MKPSEYQLIMTTSTPIMNEKVTEALADGWRLRGEVKITIDEANIYFIQTLVR